MATLHRVCSLAELPIGQLRRAEVAGVSICLAHAEDDGVYAVADTCTHEEQSLSEGELYGMAVECPLHGSCFDLRTGAVDMPPAFDPVATYRTEVRDGEIFVEA
jgi:3-phenylpropionate/trans-cinnamate dioxygenase ferredoxin subunit